MSTRESPEQVRWDLSDLVALPGEPTVRALPGEPTVRALPGEPTVRALPGEPTVRALLDDAQARAGAFAARYRGALESIDGAGLVDAMSALAEIYDLVGRADSFASLDFATDTTDPARGALVAFVHERVDALLGHDGLDFCRHHLRTARRYRPHLLSEPEELILTEKSLSGAGAWTRLFGELTAAIEVQLEDTVTLDVALSRLSSPSREVRRESAAAVTRALQGGVRTRAFIFNTLLVDKGTDDRLRHYEHWLAARNLANEASDESVQALISAVTGRYELARRWYRLKASLLGIERLADYDRMAPLAEDDVQVDWGSARELVLDAYASFSPALGELVERFFAERWIDAPPLHGKQGGAFCAYTVPSVHPYVLLNFTGRRRDVLTLAHELGHGVHAALAQPQGIFHQGTPLTLAETASVFGEALTFGRLLEASPTPAARLALLAEDIEGAIATVFRQVAMNQFERLVHAERRERGELSVERFGELWAQTQEEFLADSVEVTDDYHCWWSYIPHFIHTPGYVYAYAYGQLLALSVYERRLAEGPAFEGRYLELLSSGGSRSPEELGAIVGVDLSDPGFWDRGLDLVERRLDAAEEAARAVAGRPV
jgi:oligoendopeptidase F